DADSPKGMMYGFLNVFFAAALIYSGEAEETALAALQETHASAFTFEDGAILWRDKIVTADQMAASRAAFAIAFGSCSFRDPVDGQGARRRPGVRSSEPQRADAGAARFALGVSGALERASVGDPR